MCVCVCVCDLCAICVAFLVEVTDLPKAGFELTTCRFGSALGYRNGSETIVTEKGCAG